MSIFSAITDVEMHHNPNEGRVIINDNFRKMISGVTDSINSLTGGTSYIGTSVFISGSTGAFSIKANNDSGINATGAYTVAEGGNTIASGDYSHAEGYFSVASGSSSHAQGSMYLLVPEYGIFSYILPSIFDPSFENLHIASGASSHIEGQANIAYGSGSHAEGILTRAFGLASHSEGLITTSSGQSSHAEGYQTLAVGSSSHSEGYYTSALGNYSHAGGFESIASGINSFIHSSKSSAKGNRSVVIGGQNITGSTDDTVYVPDFVIKKVAPVPSSSIDASGEDGSITWDNNYFYWKANGQWLRISGLTF